MPFLDKSEISKLAKDLNLNLIGFTKVKELNKEVSKLSEWISKGFHAKMGYMERNIEKKLSVKNILPTAESVISLGVNYYHDIEYDNRSNMGRISRYAAGKDYHNVIEEKIEKLIARIIEYYPDFQSKYYVDSGPVMDKAWAVNAGLGWMGKNSNIINEQIGSWFFIGNIITNYAFEYDVPVKDKCGTCTACIDACPTSAIIQPYVVDSNKCISYLTIENKGDISNDFKGKFNNRIFGCDICQEVCPWNIKFAEETTEEAFSVINKEIELDSLEFISSEEFNQKYKNSPIKRAKLKGMIRNANFLKLK